MSLAANNGPVSMIWRLPELLLSLWYGTILSTVGLLSLAPLYMLEEICVALPLEEEPRLVNCRSS